MAKVRTITYFFWGGDTAVEPKEPKLDLALADPNAKGDTKNRQMIVMKYREKVKFTWYHFRTYTSSFHEIFLQND